MSHNPTDNKPFPFGLTCRTCKRPVSENEPSCPDCNRDNRVKCPQCGKMVNNHFPYCEWCASPLGDSLEAPHLSRHSGGGRNRRTMVVGYRPAGRFLRTVVVGGTFIVCASSLGWGAFLLHDAMLLLSEKANARLECESIYDQLSVADMLGLRRTKEKLDGCNPHKGCADAIVQRVDSLKKRWNELDKSLTSAKVKTLLRKTREHADAQRWDDCVSAADEVLALDAFNADALRLKATAQDEIEKRDEPRVRLVALLNGVPKNARVVGTYWYEDKTTEDSVFTFASNALGKAFTFDVEYEEACTRYAGRGVYAIEKGEHDFKIDLHYRDTLKWDRRRCGYCGASLENSPHVYKCPECLQEIKADAFL